MDKEQAFIARLRDSGERVSSARIAVFRYMVRRGPLYMPKLADAMRRFAIDPATTYRTLTLFRKLDIVREIVAGGKRLVELSDDFSGHHHHFWCRKCGRLVDFDNAAIEQALEKVAEELGVEVSSHQLEISGLCKTCRPRRRKAGS